jgi:GT2 family glycosyltransferase
MISIILPIFQRPHRFKEILKDLAKQTEQDFMLNVWNNSDVVLDLGSFPREKVRIVRSPKNISGGDRWKLIPLTKAEVIISIDDDMSLEPDFLEYNLKMYRKYGEDCLLGWYSKTWVPGETDYHKDTASQLPEGMQVDYIGTGGMVGSRRFFEQKIVIENEVFYDKYQCEDIFLSYLARKQGMKLISVGQKCKLIDDKVGSNYKYKNLKAQAFKMLVLSGWDFL